ncbi:snRNA-activating protein complex subunit 5-like [Haliotis cracherodii]|uniref:snRNA-activating protein complex subunit 5-like n=1 Tax=Haliotis cracherodii TaxID=6455 RepID=UPI0039ECE302
MSVKEQQMLKEEERSLVNLHTKLSDQLNRLKVEELALISMLRLQNRPTSSTLSQHTDQTDDSKGPVKQEIQSELAQLEEKYQEALDLSVTGHLGMSDYHEEEEEEEDEDDEDDDEPETVTDQLSAFLDELSARNK